MLDNISDITEVDRMLKIGSFDVVADNIWFDQKHRAIKPAHKKWAHQHNESLWKKIWNVNAKIIMQVKPVGHKGKYRDNGL